MTERYDHKKIEKKWQEKWKESDAFRVEDNSNKEKYYLLVEFPYPSGNLHVGHWYAFAVPDIAARYHRMRGKNVLFPIGFDAFGLPAENAAIKRGINPRVWTYDNMAHMREQIASMGASFDWSREVVTCDPKYYKWTQQQFIELYKRGLVYRKETTVNWCPVDKTVLANEQVIGGHCERCGTQVEQRLMSQWNIKITDYADRLIDDLAELDWPKQIKESQINWIGRSEGAEIDFKTSTGESIAVFTTRADTLFGATFLVLAPEHPFLQTTKQDASVGAYISAAKNKTEIERMADGKEKTGVELKGVKAINPATREEIPIYVADYVLGNYGTGAIMAVPAHDERDFAFATKYSLPIRQVIVPYTVVTGADAPRSEENIICFDAATAIIKHWEEDKYYVVEFKNGQLGLPGGHVDPGETQEQTVRREVAEETGFDDIKKITLIFEGAKSRGYKSRKSREELCTENLYVIELASGKRNEIDDAEAAKGHWMTAEELLQKRPLIGHHQEYIEHFISGSIFTGDGVLVNSGDYSGLRSDEAKKKITEFVGGRVAKKYHLRDWVISRQRYWGVPIPMIHCDECGYNPVPETQLPVELPEIEDYLPTGDGKSPLAKVREWVEVPCPSCSKPAKRETDTFDTFVDSSWYFLRYADPNNEKEFASKKKLEKWMPVDMYSGGSEHTTVHVLYSRFWNKALFDAGLVPTSEPYTRRMNRGLIMGPDGQKMSKSKGNVIDPDEVVGQLGADTVRMYLAFIGPYNEIGSYPWNPNGAVGVRRFLERVWAMHEKVVDIPTAEDTEGLMHQTIKKVGDDIASLKTNTAVSALMVFSNHLHNLPKVPKETYVVFLSLLAPFAPHIVHELAEKVGVGEAGITEWPKFDPARATSQSVAVAVQINGRVRTTLDIAHDLSEDDALSFARSNERVAKWLEGSEVVKTIYVPGKVINFVLKGH